jgi:hypothetical protein
MTVSDFLTRAFAVVGTARARIDILFFMLRRLAGSMRCWCVEVFRMRLAALLLVLAGSPVFADIVASTTVPFSLGGTLTSVDLTSVPNGLGL